MSLLSSHALQQRQMLTPEEIENTLHHIRRLYVAQLKELIKPLHLQVGGKRQDLIDRLEQHIRHCQVTGQNVRLLALRTIVLKMMTNDPIPNFDNLYNALQSGVIDQQLMSDQLARLQNLANKIKGKPRLSAVNTQPGMAHMSARSASDVQAYHPYSPQYKGPTLRFPSSLLYQQQLLVHRFPFVIPASKGRNLCNITVRLHPTEISLLQVDKGKRLYLFGGLPSDPNPSFADIQFPPIEIHVEGINTKQYVKGLKGKRGTCRPADLTDFVNPTKTFTINIVYSDAAEEYVLYLYIVDARTPDALVEYIKGKDHISEETTKAAIKSEYDQNQDDDIVMATSSLTLRCPLTYARLSTPIRSIECDHIQCFDALSFLTMQERIPSWICPVCSKKINPGHLAVSDYLQSIIATTSDEIDTVNINTDGTWEPLDEEGTKDDDHDESMNPANQSRDVSSAPKVDESIEIISLDSDSEDEQPDVTMRSVTDTRAHSPERSTPQPVQGEVEQRNLAAEERNNQDESIDDATLTEIESALNQNMEATAPSTSAFSSMVADSTAKVNSDRQDSVSSDDRPIQSYNRKSRIIDVEDDEMDEGGVAEDSNATTKDNTIIPSVEARTTPQYNSPPADITAPLFHSGNSETFGRFVGERNLTQPPSSASEMAPVPRTSIHQTNPAAASSASAHLPNKSATEISIPNHNTLSNSVAHNVSSTSIQRNLPSLHTTKGVVEMGNLAALTSEEDSATNVSTVPVGESETTPGRRDTSTKSPPSDALDTPRAKRLKIPTDPNYSIIENIVQTISRPASTDNVNQNLSSQPTTPASNADTSNAKTGVVVFHKDDDPQSVQKPNNGSSLQLTGVNFQPEAEQASNPWTQPVGIGQQFSHTSGNQDSNTSLAQPLQLFNGSLSVPRLHENGGQNSSVRPLPSISLISSDRQGATQISVETMQQRQHEWQTQQQELRRLQELHNAELRRHQLEKEALRQQELERQRYLVFALRQTIVQAQNTEYQEGRGYFPNQIQQVPSVNPNPMFASLSASVQPRPSEERRSSQLSQTMETRNQGSGSGASQFRQLVLNSSALINQFKEMQSDQRNNHSNDRFQTMQPPAGSASTKGSPQPLPRLIQSGSYPNGQMSKLNGVQAAPNGAIHGQYNGHATNQHTQAVRSVLVNDASSREYQANNILTQGKTSEESTKPVQSRSVEDVRTPATLEKNNNSLNLNTRSAPPELHRSATSDGSSLANRVTVRYSKSPFDQLHQETTESVKGLLGIEVQLDLLTSIGTRTSLELPGSRLGDVDNASDRGLTLPTAEPLADGIANSSQPYNADVPSATSVPNKANEPYKNMQVENGNSDKTLVVPTRRVSLELPERTWNKKLSKKFNPSEINLSNLIELDDD